MDSKSSWSQQNLSGTASFGSELFTTMSEHCMELTSVKRQNSSQSHFKDLLSRLRLGDANYHDANTLLSLHLSNYSSEKRKQILNEGVVMHLFATKAPRNEHNYQRLSETSNEDNPVALVKAQWSSTRGLASSTIAQHYDSPPESATLLCRGAMVRIVDRNFEPGWGLYNNSIGTVRDIVFAPGDDPNSGDLPQYIAVEFSHYTGPAWDPANPKVVPIPMVTQRCDKKCCCVKFCPLDLSFGMTSHTFQGQSAGPVDEGQQPKSAVDRVIADPGTRSFEGNNPGTLYMICSRATTTGTGQLDSAIYFSGPNTNKGRVLDLKHQKGTKKLYKKVALREACGLSDWKRRPRGRGTAGQSSTRSPAGRRAPTSPRTS